jgi:hypothetical protein
MVVRQPKCRALPANKSTFQMTSTKVRSPVVLSQSRQFAFGQLFQNVVALECVKDGRFGDFEDKQAQATLNRREKLLCRGWQTLT